ncbi:MAG: hypothetical protein LBV04_07820 [Deferribacteraceae bacterium]|jgi:predicted enzyme related to lactoylglutathione lyase|nr:hypothetical protein [Deferribacteraceae bacterium]
MFFKIGFFVLLVAVIALVVLFMRTNPMKAEGVGSWIDYYSAEPEATIKFLSDNFGIQAQAQSTSVDGKMYTTLKAKGQPWPFAGIMAPPTNPDGSMVPPSTMVYLTTNNYEETHNKMMATGAVALAEAQVINDQTASKMTFGIYIIPGGVTIGVAQYGK